MSCVSNLIDLYTLGRLSGVLLGVLAALGRAEIGEKCSDLLFKAANFAGYMRLQVNLLFRILHDATVFVRSYLLVCTYPVTRNRCKKHN